MGVQDNIPTDRVPSSQGAPPQCPDCGCHPHRHAEPHRDKTCPHCGCPDLRQAKLDRDSGHIASHGDSARPAQGFY